MKKKSLLLLLSLVLVGGMVFTSCSKDDDDKGNGNSEEEVSTSILGAWKATDFTNLAEGFMREYYYFEDNGYMAVIKVLYDKDKKMTGYVMDIRDYKFKGDKLSIYDYDWSYNFKKKTLTLTDTDGTTKKFAAIDKKEVQTYIDKPGWMLVGAWKGELQEIPDGYVQHYLSFQVEDDFCLKVNVYYNKNHTFKSVSYYHAKWSYEKLILRMVTQYWQQDYSPDYLLGIHSDNDDFRYEYYNYKNEYFSDAFERCEMSEIEGYLNKVK